MKLTDRQRDVLRRMAAGATAFCQTGFLTDNRCYLTGAPHTDCTRALIALETRGLVRFELDALCRPARAVLTDAGRAEAGRE